jgi:Tat protein secretion system quality control protein TatD with DNase activity
MLMDSHAHIQTRQFDKDRDGPGCVRRRSGAYPGSGIEVETSRLAVNWRRYSGRIFAAVGVHPTMRQSSSDALSPYANWQSAGVVAIGETGLTTIAISPHETQRASLLAQMELARELDLHHPAQPRVA